MEIELSAKITRCIHHEVRSYVGRKLEYQNNGEHRFGFKMKDSITLLKQKLLSTFQHIVH